MSPRHNFTHSSEHNHCVNGALALQRLAELWSPVYPIRSACAKFSIPYRDAMQMREPRFDVDSFARRHIGPNEEEVRAMLREVGFDSLGALIDATVPKDIRLETAT